MTRCGRFDAVDRMSIVAERLANNAGFRGMSRSLVRRIAIWVSLVFLCLAAFVALLLMRGIERQIDDVTQSYGMRTAARELTHVLSQAEASQRGFLLTGDPQFLDPYEQAVAGVDRRVEALLAMTADDAEQDRRMAGITGDIAGKMAEMARAVELMTSQRTEEAQSLTQTGMGVRLMADVNQTLEDFIAEEDLKLAARNAAIDQTRLGLIVALIAALAAAAILAYALLARTQRQVSALTSSQRGLVSQKEALEAEIAARTRDIEEARAHAERERQRVETLLQDTNHRVGNSLATVSSLLALQVMRSHSTEVQQALEAARLRVHAIASAHRRLRLGDDLESASADEFLSAVIEDIAATQTDGGRIRLSGDIAPIDVSARDATTLGILVGELVTNALKHAFPEGRSGSIHVRLFRDAGGTPVLEVEDDGAGLPDGEGPGESGLGSVIVGQLAGQFGGTPRYAAPGEHGVRVTITLPGLVRPPKMES